MMDDDLGNAEVFITIDVLPVEALEVELLEVRQLFPDAVSGHVALLQGQHGVDRIEEGEEDRHTAKSHPVAKLEEILHLKAGHLLLVAKELLLHGFGDFAVVLPVAETGRIVHIELVPGRFVFAAVDPLQPFINREDLPVRVRHIFYCIMKKLFRVLLAGDFLVEKARHQEHLHFNRDIVRFHRIEENPVVNLVEPGRELAAEFPEVVTRVRPIRHGLILLPEGEELVLPLFGNAGKRNDRSRSIFKRGNVPARNGLFRSGRAALALHNIRDLVKFLAEGR